MSLDHFEANEPESFHWQIWSEGILDPKRAGTSQQIRNTFSGTLSNTSWVSEVFHVHVLHAPNRERNRGVNFGR